MHITLDDVELEDGKKSKREVVNHPGGVTVAALDDDNNLLFVRQFRYPYKEVVLELPAGKLEKGSTPLENGKRELLEETGAQGYSYTSLGQLYPSPGYTNEIIHLYVCRIKSEGESKPDEGEFWMSRKFRSTRRLKWCSTISCRTQNSSSRAENGNAA